MIEIGNPEHTSAIKRIWKTCFSMEDERYTDFFFQSIFQPEYGYVWKENGEVVSTLCRIPHAYMFNGRILQTSMIVGVATLPEFQGNGYMHQLMDTVLDACEHSELLTLIQAYHPELYEPSGFEMMYHRQEVTITSDQVKRITNVGCGYDPTPVDMLKCYCAFINRFNGYYARDLESFIRYKKEIAAQGGKIIAYYNSKGNIRGYATLLFEEGEVHMEECVYLDSMSFMKLLHLAFQERNVAKIHVSDAEDLGKLVPGSTTILQGSTMARINDGELLSRLYGTQLHTIKDFIRFSEKPLNLNEFI